MAIVLFLALFFSLLFYCVSIRARPLWTVKESRLQSKSVWKFGDAQNTEWNTLENLRKKVSFISCEIYILSHADSSYQWLQSNQNDSLFREEEEKEREMVKRD